MSLLCGLGSHASVSHLSLPQSILRSELHHKNHTSCSNELLLFLNEFSTMDLNSRKNTLRLAVSHFTKQPSGASTA